MNFASVIENFQTFQNTCYGCLKIVDKHVYKSGSEFMFYLFQLNDITSQRFIGLKIEVIFSAPDTTKTFAGHKGIFW